MSSKKLTSFPASSCVNGKTSTHSSSNHVSPYPVANTTQESEEQQSKSTHTNKRTPSHTRVREDSHNHSTGKEPPLSSQKEEDPQLKIPVWQPQQFMFKGDVLHYEPGLSLAYVHSNNPRPILLYYTCVLLLGWGMGGMIRHASAGLLTSIILATPIAIYLWKHSKYTPTRWEFRWHEGIVLRIHGEHEQEFELEDVQQVRLFHQQISPSYRSQTNIDDRISYNARIYLDFSSPLSPLEVAQTGPSLGDPEGTYYDGLTFANMLAATIQVPLHIELDEKKTRTTAE